MLFMSAAILFFMSSTALKAADAIPLMREPDLKESLLYTKKINSITLDEAQRHMSQSSSVSGSNKSDEILEKGIPVQFPDYVIGPDGYLNDEGKLVPYKDKEERNQYHSQIVNSYLAQVTMSLGKPDFALKVWQFGNSIARLQRKNNLYLTHKEKSNLLDLLKEQIKNWCEYHLKKDWNRTRCQNTLEEPLQDLNSYFWKDVSDKMHKSREYREDTPANIDHFIQNVEMLDENSKGNVHIKETVNAMDYVKKLIFLENHESNAPGVTYNTSNFVVGSNSFNGKAYTNEISRNFLHGAVTNEYANRVVGAIGQPHMETAIWHNVNAVARLRRNNNIFLREKGVNLQDKTDYHLSQSLKKFCDQEKFKSQDDKNDCYAHFEEMKNLVDELNEQAWTRYDPKRLDSEERALLIQKYAYRFEGLTPGSQDYEDRLVDVMVQEEARDPKSRVNEILRLIGKPGSRDPTVMSWFYSHGYKADPNLTLAKLTDTKTLSEPSFTWEIKKMIADKHYVTPYFKTSPALYTTTRKGRSVLVREAGLVQIPLNPKAPSVGPCGSFHYNAGLNGNDAYASPITACAFTALMQEWRKQAPAGIAYKDSAYRLSWGDISKVDAMYFNDHSSHTIGNCVDIRPFRKDEFKDEPLTFRDNAYSPSITQKFINMAKDFGGETILFNDPNLRSCRYEDGHHNHIHVCFPNSKKTREVCGNFKVDPNACPTLAN
jgi:hypothetical protein